MLKPRLLTTLMSRYPLEFEDSDGEILPQCVIRLLDQLTNGQAIITAGVGQHQMWAGQFIISQSRGSFDFRRVCIPDGVGMARWIWSFQRPMSWEGLCRERLFVHKSSVPSDHDLFIIVCQTTSDHLGDVTSRSLKAHQVRLAPDRQLCSGISGPSKLNVDLFFADRVRHRNPIDLLRSGRNGGIHHLGIHRYPIRARSQTHNSERFGTY